MLNRRMRVKDNEENIFMIFVVHADTSAVIGDNAAGN